jgi:5'-3' exonuclease
VTILLIDLSSVLYPIWHQSGSSPNPNEASIQTIAKVRALASGQAHVAICCDAGRSFRRELDPTYKAQRPETDATLLHQMALSIEALTGDGFPVWAVPGFEADDLIASAVEWAEHPVLIASSDKDLLQLVKGGGADGPAVIVKRLHNGMEMDEGTVYLDYGVTPTQFVDYLSLVGDSSDNIKGADGIGPKKAAAMLTKFGTLEDLYAALDQGDEKFQPSTIKALTEFRPRMDLVRSLVTLRRDVPLPFDDIFKDRVPQDVAVFGEEELMVEVKDVPEIPYMPQVPLPEVLPAPPTPAPLSMPQMSIPNNLPALMPMVADTRWQLEPRSMPEAIELAKHMHASRLFSAYGTPQAVLATILAGRELGIQAMASLRQFHIIDSRPAMSADLIRGLVQRSAVCEYFRCVERTAEQSTWETKRKGDPEPTRLTFTIAQGRAAWQKDEKAWQGSAWTKRAVNMVTKTASTELARLVYADIVGNMYSPEELTGEERS